MSGKYDVESFLNELLATIKANLPAKIDEVNEEKADNSKLCAVKDTDYYNDISDQILNAEQFIYYALVSLETQSNAAATAITITVNIEIVFNNTNKTDTLEKVLRYSRCLREVVQNNFKSGRHSNLQVSELLPGNAQLNEGADFKIGGIAVKSTIVG